MADPSSYADKFSFLVDVWKRNAQAVQSRLIDALRLSQREQASKEAKALHEILTGMLVAQDQFNTMVVAALDELRNPKPPKSSGDRGGGPGKPGP